MVLKDTIELMQSDNYKARVIAEYCQAKIRHKKLGEYINKLTVGQAQVRYPEQPFILGGQLASLASYIEGLEARAHYEDIELPAEV